MFFVFNFCLIKLIKVFKENLKNQNKNYFYRISAVFSNLARRICYSK